MSPLCSCSLEIESTEHYFLRCHNYVTFRTTLMNELDSITSTFNTLEPDQLVRTILYGETKIVNDNDSNLKVLTTTILSNKLEDLSKLFY